MGKRIITSLNEFVLAQPATKPTTKPETKPSPTTTPAPSRPGRPVPTREPRPQEEERPMAKKKFGAVMGNLKKSIVDEMGTELGKSVMKKLKGLKNLPQE